MTDATMNIYTELTWRGLIHQVTDAAHLAQWLSSGSRTLYVGFDPTADSLHVGHFLPLMTLRRFQRAGHRPIALVGGATGMIGDPSGKSEERNLLSVDTLRKNVAAMQEQMRSSSISTPVPKAPSWSITTTGWLPLDTSISCATSARTFRSTSCWLKTRSAADWSERMPA